MSAPFDPFQRATAPGGDAILSLGRQWDDLTRQIDDDAAYHQANLADTPCGGDKLAEKLWL